MKLSKSALFASFVLVTACTTVNVDPASQGGENKVGQNPTPTPTLDPSQTDGSQNPAGSKDSGSVSNNDSGGPGPGADSGGVWVDSGGVWVDSGGPGPGTDSGGGTDGGVVGFDSGGGIDSGSGTDGGTVTSNTENWNGWNSTTSCPAWNPAPYSWKSPKTSGVGSTVCGTAVTSFYDAYLGPSASVAAQNAWDTSFPACKLCAFSNWNDTTWGPVVRTPNGHVILNQAGCYALTDPGRLSCAHSSWNYQQCGVEACDTSASQSAYQTCVATSGGALNAACGNASFGKGMADSVIYQSGSAAWNACYATGFSDNDKQTAMRVLLAFCY